MIRKTLALSAVLIAGASFVAACGDDSGSDSTTVPVETVAPADGATTVAGAETTVAMVDTTVAATPTTAG